jgi:hypothetical protein
MHPIATARLQNQMISGSKLQDPAAVSARMLAVQGQDFASAKWSLGLRSPGSTEAGVEEVIAAGKILRTWALRGTLHLVHAADIYWLLALMAPRVIAMNARRYAELELDEPTLKRSNALLVKMLAEAAPQDRKSLMALLERSGISTAGQRAPYILQRASLDRLIVQVAVIRNEPQYALLPEAEPGALLEREHSLAELARRYFTSRGPASLQDFVWWSGLTISDARTGLEQIEEQLVKERVGETDYWRSPVELQEDDRSPSAYLLPSFDEYLVSYKDRSAMMDIDQKRLTAKNGILSAVVVLDGRVTGSWKRTIKREQVKVEVQPFTALTGAQEAAIAAAASSLCRFLNKQVMLSFTGVDDG